MHAGSHITAYEFPSMTKSHKVSFVARYVFLLLSTVYDTYNFRPKPAMRRLHVSDYFLNFVLAYFSFSN